MTRAVLGVLEGVPQARSRRTLFVVLRSATYRVPSFSFTSRCRAKL